MKSDFSTFDWLAFLWILLQTYLFITLIIFCLRRNKLLKSPVSGMEYGHIAMAGSILLGALFVSTAVFPSIFQTVKTLQAADGNALQNLLSKFSQYFLITAGVIGVYILLSSLNARIFFREAKLVESEKTSLPVGLLITAINLGVSVILWFCLKELAEMITPVYINFR